MIVENGKCITCGKTLEGKRLFLCQECQEKQASESGYKARKKRKLTWYERTMLAGAIMDLDRRYWNGWGGDVE